MRASVAALRALATSFSAALSPVIARATAPAKGSSRERALSLSTTETGAAMAWDATPFESSGELERVALGLPVMSLRTLVSAHGRMRS